MLEYTKNTNDNNFLLYWGPESSPKGPHPHGVIQPKRYMYESFSIKTITCWNIQKHQWQQLSPVQGPRQKPERAICPLTDLFSRTDTWMNIFAFKLFHLGVHINTNDSNFLLYWGPDSSLIGPYDLSLIYSVKEIHGQILFPLDVLHFGAYKYINDSNHFLIYSGGRFITFTGLCKLFKQWSNSVLRK